MTYTPKKREVLEKICKEYINFLRICLDPHDSTEKWVKSVLTTTEDYLNFLNRKEYDVFSHQSDFKSSLIPEFIYLMFKRVIASLELNLEVAAQKQIMIESRFIPRCKEPMAPKLKRVDVAILKPCNLLVENEPVENFAVPLIAIENKKNIDKNMIAGVEHSVESLKKTFPLCKYYLIGEFADFAVESQNYAASFIDEILILRKQKRSQVRRGKTVSKIDLDLLLGFKNEIEKHLIQTTQETVDIKEKMKLGRLVRREKY